MITLPKYFFHFNSFGLDFILIIDQDIWTNYHNILDFISIGRSEIRRWDPSRMRPAPSFGKQGVGLWVPSQISG